ncbi:MAG TPA: NAD(P)-dependent oxidoreductase [Opitutus sp.]|nr:NAD(P)-dependent oxidoreductase [Opitutus sp.]
METKNTHVTIIGLGIMGGGMARRLLAAGFAVTVYNRSRAKAEPLGNAGASLAGNPREAARKADVIVSMVADDAAARAVWLGENGALAGAKRGAIAIESSTVTPGWIRELSSAAKKAEVGFLDAPVTGSRTQAAAGELNFLVGGDAAALERVRPVLAAMSRTVVHLGPVGSGALVKLINNFMCGVQVAATAEAVAMIERGGLNRDAALGVLTNGAPGSPLVKAVSARMTAADYTPNFFVRLMAKDLGYAVAAAKENALDLVTARAALAIFERGIAEGHGDKDIAAVVEPLRKDSPGERR